MNSMILAKTLGSGVARAAILSYGEALSMLEGNEVLSDTLTGDNEDFATYEILPVQELSDHYGECVELRVLASDGENQLIAYYCAYSKPLSSI